MTDPTDCPSRRSGLRARHGLVADRRYGSGQPSAIVVPMPVDATRPYRRPAERLALVEQILALPPEAQETDWIEWKSSLDLTAKVDLAKLAKHILAFANRLPTVASRHCAGYSYIVVGAEPGRLTGIEVVDAARLDQGLQPYLGTGDAAPLWTPDWVAVNGTYVLVIEVEAPRRGMPIYGSHGEVERAVRVNEVYVRRHGKSDRATLEEIQALAQRSVGGSDVALAVDVETGRTPHATIPRWRYDAETDEYVIAEARDEARGWRRVGGVGDLLGGPSQKQLHEYAVELEDVALYRAVMLGCQRPGARLDLTLRNLTDRPFRAVRVEVRLDGTVAVPEDEVPDLPHRPEAAATWMPHYALGPIVDVATDPEIVYDGDLSVVTFDPVDLRPHAACPLPPFWVLAVDRDDAPAPSTITGQWNAAAMNAIGSPSGEIILHVDDTLAATAGLAD